MHVEFCFSIFFSKLQIFIASIQTFIVIQSGYKTSKNSDKATHLAGPHLVPYSFQRSTTVFKIRRKLTRIQCLYCALQKFLNKIKCFLTISKSVFILNAFYKQYGSKIRPNETFGLIFDPYRLIPSISFC